MTLLAWIIRAVVFLILLRAIFRMLAAGARTAPSGPQPRPAPPAVGGNLVRDPQCGTYVLESRAIALARGGDRVFFCSPACRDAWTAAH